MFVVITNAHNDNSNNVQKEDVWLCEHFHPCILNGKQLQNFILHFLSPLETGFVFRLYVMYGLS